MSPLVSIQCSLAKTQSKKQRSYPFLTQLHVTSGDLLRLQLHLRGRDKTSWVKEGNKEIVAALFILYKFARNLSVQFEISERKNNNKTNHTSIGGISCDQCSVPAAIHDQNNYINKKERKAKVKDDGG